MSPRLENMSRWITVLLIISCLAVTGVPQAVGYFGLTSRSGDFMVALTFNLEDGGSGDQPTVAPLGLGVLSRRKICDLLKLNGRQKRMCTRGKGIAETLIGAIKMSVAECQNQFQSERWNCSMGKYRLQILETGFKETAYLYALSSAALVHAFSRACSRDQLNRCTCDESLARRRNKDAWRWGGCGDNIKFGHKFTRRFLKSRGTSNDLRGKMDLHNSRAGIKIVKDGVKVTCKCHGLSGSCNVKTCWRQLTNFHFVGNLLKGKYEKAVKVAIATNGATGQPELIKVKKNIGVIMDPKLESVKDRTLGDTDLVYFEDGPSFCKPGRYSAGTFGRSCSKGANCDATCCGRGYNVQTRTVTKPCKCQVIWCCEVKCQRCVSREEMYTCK